MAKLVSAFACSHAPQIITTPRITDEYVGQVKRVQQGLMDIGKKLKNEDIDLLIMIGADHLESLFFDNYPMILLPTVETAGGQFADEKYEYSVDLESSKILLKSLVSMGFDISFSQKFKLDHPFRSPLKWIEKEFLPQILPIHINSNIPPVISTKRAYEFGKSIRRAVELNLAKDKRVAIIGTGGLSHYPGTPLYGKVDIDFDRKLLRLIEEGKGENILKFTDEELQQSGNLEIRTWMTPMGASFSGKGKVLMQVPTFHIDYALVEFDVNNGNIRGGSQ